MKPQQQLSQIEKSVTHLLVATKQLLGPALRFPPAGRAQKIPVPLHGWC